MQQKMKQKRPFHVMIIPTLGCPSKCAYCWSSQVGSPVMSIETIRAIVGWSQGLQKRSGHIPRFTAENPSWPGPISISRLCPCRTSTNFRISSQLRLGQLTLEAHSPSGWVAKYKIPIGSSLERPKELNDLQRSKGYYARTMKGYELAKKHGLQVQFICTFTSHSVQFKEDIFKFFMDNHLTLKLHPGAAPL